MKNLNSLIVSEVFHSIQGEGSSTGCPSVFLRLGGCNLLCKSKTWVCDTIEVWQKGKLTPFEDILSGEYLEYLRRGDHLVITGGEPLLHEPALFNYLMWLFAKFDIRPFVEIETNGTIVPEKLTPMMVDQYNVSFKLSNSGMTWQQRVNELALKCFSKSLCTHFKIVVSSEADVLELINDFGNLIPLKRVTLMPAGASREELEATRETVVNLCKKYGFRYSDRQHIVIWNQKTGV